MPLWSKLLTAEPSRFEFTSSPTGTVMGFPAHEGRCGAIGEVHARPHPLIEAPRVLVIPATSSATRLAAKG